MAYQPDSTPGGTRRDLPRIELIYDSLALCLEKTQKMRKCPPPYAELEFLHEIRGKELVEVDVMRREAGRECTLIP